MIELILRRNPFYDGSGNPWVVIDNEGRQSMPGRLVKAFATDEDLDALGVDEATRDEAARGNAVTFETLAMDYWRGLLETKGY